MNLAKLVKFGPFLAGAGVFVLMMTGVGYMVYASITRYAVEKAGFAQALARRTELQSRNPFPSEDNIRIEQENQRILTDKFSRLMEALSAGQFEIKSAEPTVFMRTLEGARQRMKQQLDAAGVALPPNFQYGFEKYVGGALPQEANVPRLTYQLHVIEALCRMLADAKISELIEIAREVFETDAAPTGRPRPGQPPRGGQTPPPSDQTEDALFSKSVFRLRFRALEPALMTVLNNMASNQLFMCVSNFKVRNPKDSKDALGRDFIPISEAKEKPKPPPADLQTRDKRLTLGREELVVEMDVVVYRFAARERKAEESRYSLGRASREAVETSSAAPTPARIASPPSEASRAVSVETASEAKPAATAAAPDGTRDPTTPVEPVPATVPIP